jgi:hypothetical protein
MINHQKNYVKFIADTNAMKKTADYNFETLRRKIRKHCRVNGNENCFRLQLRTFKNIFPAPSIYVEITFNPLLIQSQYTARITQPYADKVHCFQFHFDNNRELIEKIIKHDLLIKTF